MEDAEYLSYEEMLGELHALLGSTVCVQVWALVDDQPATVMLVVGELTRGRSLEGWAAAEREGETVVFNLTREMIAGFSISQATYAAGTRKASGSLEYRVGDTLIAVTRYTRAAANT